MMVYLELQVFSPTREEESYLKKSYGGLISMRDADRQCVRKTNDNEDRLQKTINSHKTNER